MVQNVEREMAKEMRGIKRDGKGIGVKGEEKEGRGNSENKKT